MAEFDELTELKNKFALLQKNKELNKQKKEEEAKAAAEPTSEQSTLPDSTNSTEAPNANLPNYSVFVSNLGPRITKEQLEDHFACCGTIKRLTLKCDHYTHIPKGYAYIEFADESGFENALKLTDSLLGGQTIEVKQFDKSRKKAPFRGRGSRRRFRR